MNLEGLSTVQVDVLLNRLCPRPIVFLVQFSVIFYLSWVVAVLTDLAAVKLVPVNEEFQLKIID